MNRVVNKAKQFVVTHEKWCKISLAALLGLYVFTFMTFGSMPKLYLLVYPALAFLGIASIICFVFLKKELRELQFLLIPLIFVICAFLSTLLGTRAFSSLKTIILLTITFYVVYAACIVIKDFKVILISLAIASFAFFIAFVAVYFKDIIRLKVNRLGTFFGNENDVGINLSFGMATILVFSLSYKKYYLSPASLLCMMAALLTGSKKAVGITIIFALFIFLYFFRKKTVALVIILAVFGLSIIALFSLPMLSSVKNRITDFFDFFSGKSDDVSTSTRLLYFNNSVFIGVRNLVLGIGANGFKAVTVFDKYSHNNFGEVLCNFGLVGLLLFYAPTIIFALHIKEIKKEEFTFVIFFFLFVLISAFSLVILDSKLYFVMLGVCYSIFFSKTKVVIESESPKNNKHLKIAI